MPARSARRRRIESLVPTTFAARRRAPRAGTAALERLEARMLLSVSPTLAPLELHAPAVPGTAPVVALDWQGAERAALAGQWVAQFDGMTGPLAEQVTTLRARVAEAGLAWRVERHLGADGLFLLSGPAESTPAEVARALASLPGLDFVEPNFVVTPASVIPNDPSFSTQWALNNTGQSGGVADADIDAPEAWMVTTAASDVVVGMIDTGIDYTHPDLVAAMWTNPGETPGDGLDNDQNGYVDDVYGWDFANNDNDPRDDAGHGTSTAGIVAAVGQNGVGGTGVAWGAKVMALKYLNSTEVGATADATAAVNYATLMRTRYGVNVRATNNSYGIAGFSQAMQSAIVAAGEAGILFVASAGNSSSDNDQGPVYPANFVAPNLLSVAATTRTDAMADFSSFGATTVHLGAPGDDIFTTRMGGGYSNTFSGTSAAAPMVAGVAALAWSAAPYASAGEVWAAILAGTDPNPALAGKTITGGRLNAVGTLAALGFYVHQATPDVGQLVTSPPTVFRFDLSHPVEPGSLDPSDLVVNGQPATQVDMIDTDTLEFSFAVSPVTSEGPVTYTLAGGNLTRSGDAEPLREFAGEFQYAPSPLAITALVPAGPDTELPLGQVTVVFNRPVDPLTVSAGDLGLSRGRVTGVTTPTATTAVFTLADVDQEGPLTIFVTAGQFATPEGTGSTGFTTTLLLDTATFPLAPFARVEPLGSFVFQATQAGQLGSALDVDGWSFTLPAGESFAAVVRPSDPAAILSLAVPGVQSLVQAAGPGQAVVLPLLAPGAGSYTVEVGGSAATAYELDVIRGAALEPGDNSAASPQAIDGTRRELAGRPRWATAGSFTGTGPSENFDDGTLGPEWSTYSSKPEGRIRLLGTNGTAGGARAMLMDTSTSSNFTLNEAIWTIDLSGQTQVQLEFWHADFSDEETAFAGPFSGHRNADGIAISGDGTNWFPIWNAPNQAASVWQFYSLDLDQLAATAGLPLASNFRIKFQQYDDFSLPTDGRGYDEIALRLIDTDAYQLDLTDVVGQPIDVVLSPRSGADLSGAVLELWDGAGSQLLATGSALPLGGQGATNFAQGLLGYVVPGAGSYQVRVRSAVAGDYSLVVTAASLDSEANDSASGFLRDLAATKVAEGHVGQPPAAGSYTLTVDPALSALTLAATISDQARTFTEPLSPQAPGSLDAALSGSFNVTLDGNTLTLNQGTLDPVANVGAFAPFGSSADFAAQVTLLGVLTAYASMRNLGFALTSGPLALDPTGQFAASGVGYKFTAGGVDYELAGSTGSLPVATPDSGNTPLVPGRWESLAGELRLTIPFDVSFEVTEPITSLIVGFHFTGEIVARLAQPVVDPDYYQLTLAAGERVRLTTQTPGDGPGESPAQTLDPRLQLYSPADELLATDDNGAADGRNARLTFTAPAAGVYRLAVTAAAGYGDYLVVVEPAPSLVGDANGDCTVGAADYAIWAAQFGQTGPGLSADFDNNGSVGAGDYALWAANFGRTCDDPGATASGAAAAASGPVSSSNQAEPPAAPGSSLAQAIEPRAKLAAWWPARVVTTALAATTPVFGETVSVDKVSLGGAVGLSPNGRQNRHDDSSAYVRPALADRLFAERDPLQSSVPAVDESFVAALAARRRRGRG